LFIIKPYNHNISNTFSSHFSAFSLGYPVRSTCPLQLWLRYKDGCTIASVRHQWYVDRSTSTLWEYVYTGTKLTHVLHLMFVQNKAESLLHVT